MIRVYEYEIDIARQNHTETKNLKQGDHHTVRVDITLLNEGKPIDLLDTMVEFIFLNSLGEVMVQTNLEELSPVIIEGNKVSCYLRESILRKSGSLKLEIRVNKDFIEIFTTPTIRFMVEYSIDADNQIEDDDNFPILIELIEKVDKFLLEYEDIKSAEIGRVNLYNNMLVLRGELELVLIEFKELKNKPQGLIYPSGGEEI